MRKTPRLRSRGATGGIPTKRPAAQARRIAQTRADVSRGPRAQRRWEPQPADVPTARRIDPASRAAFAKSDGGASRTRPNAIFRLWRARTRRALRKGKHGWVDAPRTLTGTTRQGTTRKGKHGKADMRRAGGSPPYHGRDGARPSQAVTRGRVTLPRRDSETCRWTASDYRPNAARIARSTDSGVEAPDVTPNASTPEKST